MATKGKRMQSGKEYFGVKRSIDVQHGRPGCVRVSAVVDGATKRFEVCVIGARRQPALAIERGGRRGGIRGVGKATAGMTVCTPQGQQSKCLRSKSLIVFPGGAGRLQKSGAQVLSGLRRKRRK